MFRFMYLGPATAYLFPGQGGQYIGMVKELCAMHPAAQRAMEQADDVLGFALSTLCFEGPEDALTDTINAQPAILAASIAILHAIDSALDAAGESVAAPAATATRFAAGHSFGEYTALVAVGSIRYADGLRLVRERGRLMKQAGEAYPGMMAAILGMERDTVAEICTEISEQTAAQNSNGAPGARRSVQIANDNCPGQVVISGDTTTMESTIQTLRNAGARKVVPQAVSIAAHSPLMQPAADELRAAIEETPIAPPAIPVIGNTTAQPMTTPDEIRAELIAQLTGGVRWTESMQHACAAGVANFVELGPGDALSSMMKRIDRKAARRTVNDPAGVTAFVESLCHPAT